MVNKMPARFPNGSSAPAGTVAPVTKSDVTVLNCRSLLVGTAGTANIIDGSGQTRTNVPLQAGYNPLHIQKVLTGGTATNIWALY